MHSLIPTSVVDLTFSRWGKLDKGAPNIAEK